MFRRGNNTSVIQIIIILMFPCLVSASEDLEFGLIGDRVVNLAIGESYIEEGASAISSAEGDVSSSIVRLGSVNTNRKGDYLLRYQVTDNSGGIAELIRVVRVFDDTPIQQSQRTKGSTAANLGYLEHLPTSYDQSGKQKAPLIIFNHGSGATGTGNLNSVECCGLARVLETNDWDDTLPFVVLSPQLERNADIEALNQFVDYAIRTYSVDSQRVYMAGWSAGAYTTMLYSVAYPEKLAAMVPTAGGFFLGIPSNVCDAADVPMWLFLGNQDDNFINNTGLNSANAYRNCNPIEPVRVTRFLNAGHFDTSIWPFLPEQTFAIDASSDAIDQSIFDWLLSHGPQVEPDSDFFIIPLPNNGAAIFGL